MVHNLMRHERYARRRLELAARYDENFEGNSEIVCPPRAAYPLSHYTIRVKSTARHAVRRCLWQKGLDVGMLFSFHSYLSPGEFRNTRALASEVLNLPLTESLSVGNVDRISDCARSCVSLCAAEGRA